MIKAQVGDLFESPAQTLVNTVNCVGVMGKGIALEFKERFPEMYRDYAERCARGEVRLGRPYLYRSLFPPHVLNFPTKDHWRSVSKLSDIIAGLEYLEQHYREWGIESLAVPPLGCGQGGLEWRVVGPTLYRHLSRLDIPVEMYAPFGTPQEELEQGFLAGSDWATMESAPASSSQPLHISPATLALVEIIARITREPLHWPIGRVRVQKLAYFATEAGIPTGLHFMRGSYGPFSPDVKPLLTKLVNNGLVTEEPFGRMLALKPGPTYRDAVEHPSYRDALAAWGEVIDRVVDLLQRLSTDDAELAATVRSVWKALSQDGSGPITEARVIEGVQQWKQTRARPFEEDAIREAVRNLDVLGWIQVELDPAEMEADEAQLSQV